jgi:hypothetical protein
MPIEATAAVPHPNAFQTPADAPAAAAPAAAAPAKKKRGPYKKAKRGGKNAARAARRAARPKKPAVETDPFADDARSETPEPPPSREAVEAEVVPDAAVPTDETPALGIEGARALAPMYYGVLNVATGLLVKKAPAFKNNPAEAARVALEMQLDATGHYVGDVLTGASADRHAIDPALIPVMAKLRLTAEWALVVATAGVLFAKYVAATGDADVAAAVSALSSPAA